MRDINIEVEEVLKKLGYRVVFRYPENFSRLPAISYYTINEETVMAADNAEYIQEVTVQIDIWTRTPCQGGEIAIEINRLMTSDGWTRQNSCDLPKENNIYHRTMRFSKAFMCGD